MFGAPPGSDDTVLDAFDPAFVSDFFATCTFERTHVGARRRPIDAAQPAFEQQADSNPVVIVTALREGWRALFSWKEMFNAVVGDGMVVARECDEAPLLRPVGTFAPVSLQDRTTRPRFVQRLSTIELHKLCRWPAGRPGVRPAPRPAPNRP